MKVLFVVGARPNFMKVAPIIWEMDRFPSVFKPILVHTGQHYDDNMSQVFFDELELPRPDMYLGVGSGSHTWQTAQVMLRFEPAVLDYQPDWVIVVGDVNSTLAAALVCSKTGRKIAHVEAGLRSFDRSMPEEINRLLTDQVADLLFVTEETAYRNLQREGVAPEKIHFVGNVMIDTLVRFLPKAQTRSILCDMGLCAGGGDTPAVEPYVLVTLHRPANVDDLETLREIVAGLREVSEKIKVVFPVHPRTRKQIVGCELHASEERFRLTSPLGYLDFLALEQHAKVVITDSGGIQEETTHLGVPCLTVRPNTERPVTITRGTNRLVAPERQALADAVQQVLNGSGYVSVRRGGIPLWDGHAAERIVKILMGLM